MFNVDRERNKECMKNYYYKRRNLLNHLMNHVEELKNVYLNRSIVKYYGSFLNF